MPRANEKEKSFTILEKDLNIISAVSNPKLSPYLDVFRHYPENIMLQNLGILSGFFKINDSSDESAYIVNFLSSVLKKEYYINPKRSIESSFDSALRKVNLALSEIAKEGNINWLGKIDGVVCILEKNDLHFSVCGKARVFLMRKQALSEISADMVPDDIEPNPLKTFADVSSGRVENGDKIVICEDNVFRVFSEEELRKGALRFKREKFIQFIKTALTNKLEIVGAIIIDIFEKEEEKKIFHEENKEIYNVFSKNVFEKKVAVPKKLTELLASEEHSGYTDGKTGHIYIQEGKEEIKKENSFGIYWFFLKEKTGDAFFWMKNRTRRRMYSIGRSISKTSSALLANAKLKLEERKNIRLEKSAAAAAYAKAMADKQAAIDKENIADEPSFTEVSAGKEEISDPIKTHVNISSAEANPKEETPIQPAFNEPFLARLQRRREELEKQEFGTADKEAMTVKEKINNLFSPFKKIIPDFGRIKELSASFNNKQKIYAGIVLLLIFIAPLVFLKIQGVMKAKRIPQQAEQKTPSARELFSEEKNIIFLDSLEKISSIQNPKSLMLLNEKIVISNESKLISRDLNGEEKEISWPENYGVVKNSAPMKDLNLGLFYTNQNKVVSFLSATNQLKENTISIPTNSKITGLGTYLTYAYLLDSENGQIYRYPRAEGGFGDKINWYKDQMSLNSSCCMTIDENVYLIDGGKILKIFKGTIQDLSLEKTLNPFTLSKIFTNSDTQNLYVLDKENGRVIKFSKDGAILGQYFHEDIKNAIDIAIDEKNNKVYLTNPEGLVSFNL